MSSGGSKSSLTPLFPSRSKTMDAEAIVIMQTRLACLTLAAQGREGWQPKDVIAVADAFVGYVLNESDGSEYQASAPAKGGEADRKAEEHDAVGTGEAEAAV